MRKFYLPADDLGRKEWLENFSAKIGAYAASFGITPAEVTAIAAYLLMLQYILGIIDSIRSFSQDLTKYKEKLMIAPLGTPLGGPPPIPPTGVAPATMPAGIFTIISGIVKRIKGHAAYTEAIAEDLRIIGADIIDDNSTKKPVVKLSYAVNNPQVKVKKNRTDGFNLYRDLGTGDGFELVGRVTKTTYVDTIPFPRE
jgi:hypothetical protein